MPCLRTLRRVASLCRANAVSTWPVATSSLTSNACMPYSDLAALPATPPPSHPFEPVITKASTGDLYVPKGAKLAGHGAHPLARYRSFFPKSVWTQIDQLFPRGSQPCAYDVAIGTGRGAIELAKRRFRVTAIESDARLLATAHTQALECGVTINSVSASIVHKKIAQQGGVADLVTIMHGIHLVDTNLALEECHRLLKPDGYLCLAWNDRDLTHPVCQQLESLVEKYNPGYDRKMKQRTKEVWGPKLLKEGLFELKEYSVHPNPLPMRNTRDCVDLLGCLPYIRVDMDGHLREDFKKELQTMLDLHYEQGFAFPLETKLFILKPINSREAANKQHAGHHGQVPFQFFPNRPT